MTLEELTGYILDSFEAECDRSFENDPTVAVFKRADNKKWFALAKNIGRRYLALEGDGRIDILNVKLNPRTVAALRTREGFLPAWRTNQNSWITVLLDGTVPDAEICGLLEEGFAHAGGKSSKKR